MLQKHSNIVLSQAADKAAEGYVGSQDKSTLVDASTGLERPMEDSAGEMRVVSKS